MLLPGVIGNTWSLVEGPVLGYGQLLGIGNWSGVGLADARSVLLSVCTLVLVYLMRADILRHREVSADVTAARWGAAASGWQHDGGSRRTLRSSAGRLLASFAELWRTHPDWDLRRDSLTDPAALFEVSSLQMFLVGAAAWVAASTLSAADLPDRPVAGPVGAAATPWLVGGLIAATLTVTLWPLAVRAALGTWGQPGADPPALRAGLWLGAGLLVGQLLDFGTSGGQLLPAQPAFLLPLPVLALIAARWTAEHARLALRTWRSVRIPVLAALGVTWLLFALGIGWWQNEGVLFAYGYPLATAADVEAFTPTPILTGHLGEVTVFTAVWTSIPSWGTMLFIITGAALWLVPLLSLTWSAGRGGLRWAACPPRPRLLIGTGAAGGVCSWAVAIAGIFILRSWHVPISERFGSYQFSVTGCLVAAAISGMAVAACAGRAISRDYWLSAGLSAVGIASLLGFGGAYLLMAADGCTGPLTALQDSCAWLPSNGWAAAEYVPPLAWGLAIFAVAALALLTAGITAGCGHMARSFRPTATNPQLSARPPHPAPPGHPAWAAARAGVVLAGACAAALIVAVNGFTSTNQAPLPLAGQPAALEPPSAYPEPPALRKFQVGSWLTDGGTNVGADLGDDVGAALDVIVATAQKGTGRLVYPQLVAPVKRACADITNLIQQAYDYFPIPDPHLQEQWQNVLNQIAAANRDCLQAFAQRKRWLLVSAAHKFDATVAPYGQLTGDLDTYGAPGGISRGSESP